MLTRCYALTTLVVLVLGLAARAEDIRGVISKVDAKKGDVVLEGRGRHGRGLVINFDVEKDTRIVFGREAGDVSDLQPGEHVRLYYETRDGRRVAVLIKVQGGRPKAAAAVDAAAPSDPNTVTGSLIRVALTDREIVVISPGAKGEEDKETTIQVPEKVQITEGKKALKLDDLKEGERVSVKTEKKDGKLAAVSIQVGGAAAAAAPPSQRPSKIQRLRELLKLADWLLQQRMEQEGERKP
jgi:hypothetical protein